MIRKRYVFKKIIQTILFSVGFIFIPYFIGKISIDYSLQIPIDNKYFDWLIGYVILTASLLLRYLLSFFIDYIVFAEDNKKTYCHYKGKDYILDEIIGDHFAIIYKKGNPEEKETIPLSKFYEDVIIDVNGKEHRVKRYQLLSWKHEYPNFFISLWNKIKKDLTIKE